MYKQILENISKHIQLNEEEEQYFISLLNHKKIKSKTFILEEGDICKHSVFVVNGCFRGFTVDKNGFEHVINFAPQNWWIGDLYSLIGSHDKVGDLIIKHYF